MKGINVFNIFIYINIILINLIKLSLRDASKPVSVTVYLSEKKDLDYFALWICFR